jgi:uncharacterized surface protein with fasciclin (FAS1) repeats
MVSIGPYTESYNMRHMFDMQDLRGCLPKKVSCPNSVSEILNSHPDFKRFAYMMKLSKLDPTYSGPQANLTLFVPSDKAISFIPEGVFTNMDDSTARHIVRSYTLNRRIPSEVLEDSPAAYFMTRDPPNRLFVSNLSGRTYLNNDVNVIHKDLEASNGIIHVIDNILWPEMVGISP